ncbi:SMI1/KNR4 family protein [Bremerella sp. JC817]|uniref:SMI1/KNR4 family protein n=1 Tax=Bremerella sp. JC817 TaxID=3231756 RepID=UPI0034578877
MEEILKGIDDWLRVHRPAYHRRLRSGVMPEKFSAFAAAFAQELPADLIALYRWHDGQDPMSSDAMQGNRTFMTFDEVCETKAELDGMIGSDFEDPRYWRRGWIPFLHNGGGSYLCVDTEAVDGGMAGQLIAFWKSDSDRPIEHLSIREWASKLLQSMQNGTLKTL